MEAGAETKVVEEQVEEQVEEGVVVVKVHVHAAQAKTEDNSLTILLLGKKLQQGFYLGKELI